jgi:hypothetical protein
MPCLRFASRGVAFAVDLRPTLDRTAPTALITEVLLFQRLEDVRLEERIAGRAKRLPLLPVAWVVVTYGGHPVIPHLGVTAEPALGDRYEMTGTPQLDTAHFCSPCATLK